MTIETDPINIEFLPADTDDLTADEDIAEVVDNFDFNPLRQNDPEIEQPYGMSWAFDINSGHFIKNGLSPAETTGIQSLYIWASVAIMTARSTHPIFDDNFGIDNPNIMIGQNDSAELRTEFKLMVEESLLIHDRIAKVRDFEFSRDDTDDSMFVSFTITTDDAETVRIQNVGI